MLELDGLCPELNGHSHLLMSHLLMINAHLQVWMGCMSAALSTRKMGQTLLNGGVCWRSPPQPPQDWPSLRMPMCSPVTLASARWWDTYSYIYMLFFFIVNAFIQHRCTQLIKSDRKDVYIIIILFQINAVLLKFLFKEYWKKKDSFHNHNCFQHWKY